jgi:hypothetical protein
LVVAAVVALTMFMVSRGLALTTLSTPTANTFSLAAGAYTLRAAPLNTPITMCISETGGGSTATATVVACTDGVAWSWIGLNGNGSVAQGHNATAAGTIMCQTLAGQYIRVYNASTLHFSSTAQTARVYYHY